MAEIIPARSREIQKEAFIKALNETIIEYNRRGLYTLRINNNSPFDLRFILDRWNYKEMKDVLVFKGYAITTIEDISDLYNWVQVEITWRY